MDNDKNLITQKTPKKKIRKFRIFISSILGLCVGIIAFAYYFLYLNTLYGIKLVIIFAIIGAIIGYTFKLIVRQPSSQLAGVAMSITILCLILGIAVGGYLLVPDEMLIRSPNASTYITSAIVYIIQSDKDFLFASLVSVICAGGINLDDSSF